MLRPARPGEKCTAFGPHLSSKRRPGGTVRWGNLPVSPRWACDSLPWPPGHCPSPRAAVAPKPSAAPRPVEGGGSQACAPGRAGGDRVAPLLGLAKSLKAPAPFLTPGASNHSVSISLTLFIPLKTHLKTLQPGVCSGLHPH